MKKLTVGIIDLVAKAPTNRAWGRIMNANFQGIMAQVVAVWCEARGHEVRYFCYTGGDDIAAHIPQEVDVVFISAFTQAAQLSYALSGLYRQRGAVTVLGGPHARCYPQDACQYFDYVLGFTDQQLIDDLLDDPAPCRPVGKYLSASRQPLELPGVRQRWKFIEQAHTAAPWIKIVPMISSLGCPYTCNFCIDADIPYHQLDYETLKGDLRFLLTRFKRPRVGWYDPNFGIRFNECMDAIEEVSRGRIDFIAESSLAVLTEPHLKRLSENGFKGILPGIESWYGMGNKSKVGKRSGEEKVGKVAEHINTILGYVPYVQANFILGLDEDEGPETFELTKNFSSRTPASFPAFSLLTAFGQASALNRKFRQQRRVLAFPFHFHNNNQAMNVRPKHYGWVEFYDHIIGLYEHCFSRKLIARRFLYNKRTIPRSLNMIRAVSSEGWGRLAYYRKIRDMLQTDRKFRAFYEQDTTEVPEFFVNWLQSDLGPLWEYLPAGAVSHDPYVFDDAERQVATA